MTFATKAIDKKTASSVRVVATQIPDSWCRQSKACDSLDWPTTSCEHTWENTGEALAYALDSPCDK